ncbi:MAG: hypothetical protein AAFQ58_14735 [Pseudomonadota bacterium]
MPWLSATIGLHHGYQLFLMAGDKIGNLTQVDPIIRGWARMNVAAVSIGALGTYAASRRVHWHLANCGRNHLGRADAAQ